MQLQLRLFLEISRAALLVVLSLIHSYSLYSSATTALRPRPRGWRRWTVVSVASHRIPVKVTDRIQRIVSLIRGVSAKAALKDSTAFSSRWAASLGWKHCEPSCSVVVGGQKQTKKTLQLLCRKQTCCVIVPRSPPSHSTQDSCALIMMGV